MIWYAFGKADLGGSDCNNQQCCSANYEAREQLWKREPAEGMRSFVHHVEFEVLPDVKWEFVVNI